jgi:hypothetical protein
MNDECAVCNDTACAVLTIVISPVNGKGEACRDELGEALANVPLCGMCIADVAESMGVE